MTAKHHRPSSKVRYTSQRTAIRKAVAASRHAGAALRLYRASRLSSWHLTKKPTWTAKPRREPAEPGGSQHVWASERFPVRQCAWLDVELSTRPTQSSWVPLIRESGRRIAGSVPAKSSAATEG